MASLAHIAVGMVAGRVHQRERAEWRALLFSMMFWSLVSLLPDADVIGFLFGVRYGDPWGHRGATHSFVFSLVLGLLIGAIGMALRLPPFRTAAFAMCVLASHALLDTLTDGGLGCALFWPFDNTRHFSPWRPIPVAPIGWRLLAERGFHVAITELLLFWPLLLYAGWPRRALFLSVCIGLVLVPGVSYAP